jgi:hypothetical protein
MIKGGGSDSSGGSRNGPEGKGGGRPGIIEAGSVFEERGRTGRGGPERGNRGNEPKIINVGTRFIALQDLKTFVDLTKQAERGDISWTEAERRKREIGAIRDLGVRELLCETGQKDRQERIAWKGPQLRIWRPTKPGENIIPFPGARQPGGEDGD